MSNAIRLGAGIAALFLTAASGAGLTRAAFAGPADDLTHMSAERLASRHVYTPTGQDLGTVHHVAVSAREREPVAVVLVVGTDGIEQRVALPFELLELSGPDLLLRQPVERTRLADDYPYTDAGFVVLPHGLTVAEVRPRAR